MAKRCDICGRGSQKDAARSHSNIKTIQRQYINLQTKKINGKKLKVCTKCIKTMVKMK
jgi:ribosomal protein L28